MTSPRHAESTAKGRYYTHPVTGQRLVSVTNAISVGMAKPALVPWAAKVTAEHVMDHLPAIVAGCRTDRDATLREIKAQVTVARDKAAANKGGRPSETSPKLGEVSDRKEREVRKAAAVGTGYSATTIDKVDRIRDAAERGVIKRGKTEVPAPAPVVAVAREQLEHVKRTGAAIDRSAKALDAAVEAYVESDADVQRARFMRSFARSLEAYTAITAYDPEQVAAAITDPDEWEDFLRSHRTVNDWFTKVREARPARLRLIGGSQ